MHIYLAGPMRGLPNFNFPAFQAGAKYLRDLGHTVFSPAEADVARVGKDIFTGTDGTTPDPDFNLRDAIGEDLNYITWHAEGVALLPGWEQSLGVAVEVALARFLQIPVAPLEDDTWKPN